VALFDNGLLIREAPAHEGTAGIARWLQQLIYGDLLSVDQLANAAGAAEQAEAFLMHESELAELAAKVWAGCLQETAGEGETGDKAVKRMTRCNPACLRRRILEQQPRARSLLEGEGWSRHFSRRLLEHGVVTYTVKNLRGCLSWAQSAQWQQRFTRGFEVPKHRLPAGTEL
jgi:hypothetical protein